MDRSKRPVLRGTQIGAGCLVRWHDGTGRAVLQAWVQLLVGGGLSFVANAVSIVILTRYLPVKQFGELALAQTAVSAVAFVGRLGLVSWGEREIAQTGSVGSVEVVVRLRLALTAVAEGILFAAVWVCVRDHAVGAIYGVLAVGAIGYSMTVDWALIVVQDSRGVGALRFARGLSILAMTVIWALWDRSSVVGASTVIAAGDVLFAVATVVRLNPWRARVSMRYSGLIVMRKSMPFAVIHSIGLLWNADVFLVRWLAGYQGVALYSLAKRLAGIAHNVIVRLVTSVAPEVNRIGRSDAQGVVTIVRQWASVILGAGLAICSVYAVAMYFGVVSVLAPKYSGLGPVIFGLVVWAVFSSVATLVSTGLGALGMERKTVWGAIAGGSACVLGTAVLVPFMGPMGAAISLVIAELAAIGVLWRQLMQRTKVYVYQVRGFPS